MEYVILIIKCFLSLIFFSRWPVVSLAVATEALTLDKLRPLISDFRRHVRTICDGESGRLQCPPHTYLFFFSALYGQDFAAAATCNRVYSPFKYRHVLRETCQLRSVRPEATAMCQGNNSCVMRSHHFRRNSDNCQGVPKYLRFEFACLPLQMKTQFVCADSYVEVQCESSGQKLLVVSASLTANSTYGATHCPTYSRASGNGCVDRIVTNAVRKECHKKFGCSVSSPPTSVLRDIRCPKPNTVMRYICVSRKSLSRSERPTPGTHVTIRARKRRPTEKYIPKWTKDGRPNIMKEEADIDVNTTPGTKGTKSRAKKSNWLKIGLIIAGVVVVVFVVFLGTCQLVIRRRNRQRRAKMIRNIARQKVEDDFMKKHLGPPTSWSFPSPVSSTTGERMNMSESWIEPTDRFIMYDWPLRKSYHGDGLSSSLTRQKQQSKLEQSAIDATLPHFYHM